MNAIYTKDYQNKKILPILKEYSAKKYGRKREFVDAEMTARLWINTDENQLPDTPETQQTIQDNDNETQQTNQEIPDQAT